MVGLAEVLGCLVCFFKCEILFRTEMDNDEVLQGDANETVDIRSEENNFSDEEVIHRLVKVRKLLQLFVYYGRQRVHQKMVYQAKQVHKVLDYSGVKKECDLEILMLFAKT